MVSFPAGQGGFLSAVMLIPVEVPSDLLVDE
jgi:hypothetical protein